MSDALHAARLVLVEAAVLALLRESHDDHDQHDEIVIRAVRENQQETSIDITYIVRGLPVAGEGL